MNNIVDLINQQIGEITTDAFYDDYKIKAYEQRIFMQRETADPNEIMLVVEFGQSTQVHGQTLQPFRILVFSEENSFDVAKKLMDHYVLTYNFKRSATGDYHKQFYSGVRPLQNFIELNAGYRALFSVDGTITESSNLNDIVEILFHKNAQDAGVAIQTLTEKDTYSVTLNPLASYDNEGNVKSHAVSGVYVLAFTCYAMDNDFQDKVTDKKFFVSPPHEKFILSVKYRNGKELTKAEFVLVDTTYESEQSSLPLNVYVFTR